MNPFVYLVLKCVFLGANQMKNHSVELFSITSNIIWWWWQDADQFEDIVLLVIQKNLTLWMQYIISFVTVIPRYYITSNVS